MNPSRARTKLNAYLEDDLLPGERAKVEAALESSPELRAELRELEATVSLLRGLDRPDPPSTLVPRVMARVNAGEAEPFRWREWLLEWLEPRYAIPVAVAAVALAVVVDAPVERTNPVVAQPAEVAVAETRPEPPVRSPAELAAAEMRRMRLEHLARRGGRRAVVDILRGAGHPHSAAFASQLEGSGDLALASFGSR